MHIYVPIKSHFFNTVALNSKEKRIMEVVEQLQQEVKKLNKELAGQVKSKYSIFRCTICKMTLFYFAFVICWIA